MLFRSYWDKFSRPAETAKFGTSTDLWWFDTDKAARLDSMRQAAPQSAASGGRDTPGMALTLAAAAGVFVVAVFVFRRVMQRPPA